jgi:hypothetical protein
MTTSLYSVFVCVYSLTLLSQAFLVCAVEPSCVSAEPVGGGGQYGVDAPVDSVIRDFLASQDEGLTDMGKFHVHGWRWHTLSLVRETKRLQKLAERFQIRFSLDEGDASTTGSTTTNNKDAPHPLKQAADYVVGFNLKGLHKIEADCFFPWMREKIVSLTDGNDVSKAFATVMDQLEDNRKSVAKLGKSIVSLEGGSCQ